MADKLITPSRRGFLKSLFIAPAIVAATNIMPVKALEWMTQDSPILIDTEEKLLNTFAWKPNSGNNIVRFLGDANTIWTVPYKGKMSWDAGLFYAPYVPLQMANIVTHDMVGVSPMRAPSKEVFQLRTRYSQGANTTWKPIPGGSSLQYEESQRLTLSKAQTK